MKHSPAAFPPLARRVQEFTPELELLGEDVPMARVRLAERDQDRPGGQPFPDVPKDHWAFQAVEALRQAGIVTGELGGKFHD